MKKLLFVLISFAFLVFPANVSSQTDSSYNDYVITNFSSSVVIQKDTSLAVQEIITSNFLSQKHGIYRIVPINYTHNGVTINARLKVINITDENGRPYKYQTDRYGQSLRIKIGDPHLLITGVHSYFISYKVENVIQRYSDHDELYWNVAGNDWDTTIANVKLQVASPNAGIDKVDCYAGNFGAQERSCEFVTQADSLFAKSLITLGSGKDMTIVVALNKNNSLVFPGKIKTMLTLMQDNIGYVIAIIPLCAIFALWYKHGRDKRYQSDNVYYEPGDKKVITKPLFAREFLPLTYSPIQGISPSQLGTIVDEKVDIHDVVAEIVELARLGFYKIVKINYKVLMFSKEDYAFVKTDKYEDEAQVNKLNNYQQYLLKELFRSIVVHDSISKAEKLFKSSPGELENVQKTLAKGEYVLLSGLKNHFYAGLSVYKEKLYENVVSENYFAGNPETVRQMWLGFTIIVGFIFVFFLKYLSINTGNNGPLLVLFLTSIPCIILTRSMPKRTPRGYAMYRQAKGLEFFLGKGKWRYEIQEKDLFIEEVLPLAISLGVVDKLANDMKNLGVKPPDYFAGTSGAFFASDFAKFNSVTSTNLVSSPGGKWSGSSSWSGGSGFSGGFSGGGFGGGGGGSW